MLAGAGPNLPGDAGAEPAREATTTPAQAPEAEAGTSNSTTATSTATGTTPTVVQPPVVDAVAPPAETTVDAATPSQPVPSEEQAPVEGENVIVVSSSPRHIRADPLSGINAASFEAVQAVDRVVVAPVAGGYAKIVPKPVRNGLRNFLINLAEPIVFINYLLQFKPGKALETVGRFGINSTIGVAGLFDMAKRKPFHLPYRQNGFANTFAYHGIGNGPFLFVPVLGPTTARDLVGRVLDLSVLPALVGKPLNSPAYSLTTGTVKSLNDRVAFDQQITANRDKSDAYVATRDFYLKQRQAEIDALHSPEYRARKGIPDPVLPPIAPASEDGTPTTSIPSSMGMVPAAPAPAEPVDDAPALAPAP